MLRWIRIFDTFFAVRGPARDPQAVEILHDSPKRSSVGGWRGERGRKNVVRFPILFRTTSSTSLISVGLHQSRQERDRMAQWENDEEVHLDRGVHYEPGPELPARDRLGPLVAREHEA